MSAHMTGRLKAILRVLEVVHLAVWLVALLNGFAAWIVSALI